MQELILKFDKVLWGKDRICWDLNDYIRALTTHWSKGGKLKGDTKKVLGIQARMQNKEKLVFNKPCRINFVFFETDSKRDIDNISSAFHKVFLDTLQDVGIIKNDNRAIVRELRDKFYVGSKPMIIVRIKELTQEEIQKNEEEREIFERYEVI